MKNIQIPYEKCGSCLYQINTAYREKLGFENPRTAVSIPMNETKSCGQGECELDREQGGLSPLSKTLLNPTQLNLLKKV